jgi:hypothetical protein
MRRPMRGPTRRRRTGERGQTGFEFLMLGLGVVGIAGAMTVLVGGYLAVTYDQHHSSTPLTSSSSASPTPAPPSVVYVDHSPVGLYEGCILKVAAARGLSWDGGELGWTAAAFPRPAPSDPQYSLHLRQWRSNIDGLVSSVAASADWQACTKPELTPPPARTQEPVETLAVDGSYVVDPNSTQGIGGCGTGGTPTSMTVSGNGTSVVIRSGLGAVTLTGTFDPASASIQAGKTDADGTQHSVHGSFSSNAGVTRFTGSYDTIHDPAGCGYQFTAQKS